VLANPVVSHRNFERDTKEAAHRLGIAVSIQHVGKPEPMLQSIPLCCLTVV
jgi:putative ABC transport system substrate-binding protein